MDQDAKASVAQAELDQVFGGGGDQSMTEPKQGAEPSSELDPWKALDRPSGGKQQRAKWPRPAGKGDSWSGWKRQWGEDQEEEKAGLDPATQKLIQSMVKLSLRHEAELGRLRSETGFVLFLDTPTSSPELSFLPRLREIVGDWTTKFTNGTVTTSLRIILVLSVIRELKTRLADFMQSDEKIEKAKVVAQRWQHRSRSPLALLRLGSQAEAAVSHGAATGQDDGSAKESGPARAPHGSGGCDPQLQECRGDPGGLHDRGHTVYAHCGPEIPAGEPVLSDSAAAVGKRGHQDPQLAHPPRTLGTAVSSETGGGKLSRSQLLRLESQEESLSGNNPGDLGRSPVVAGERVPRLVLRSGLRLPQARLQNPRNYCYLNSTAQAFYWIGELTSSPDASYGLLKAGIPALRAATRVCLPDSMQWRLAIARWPNPLQQHDAGEYIRHFLDEVQPAAYQGLWQARVSNPHQVVDEGRLTTPILLHPTAGTLADLLGTWTSQYAVHALVEHQG